MAANDGQQQGKGPLWESDWMAESSGIHSMAARADPDTGAVHVLQGSNNLHVCRLADDHFEQLSVVDTPGDYCWGVDVTPDGRFALCGNQDGNVRMYEWAEEPRQMGTGGLDSGLDLCFESTREQNAVRCVGFVGDFEFCASGSWDHKVSLFRPQALTSSEDAEVSGGAEPIFRERSHTSTVNCIEAHGTNPELFFSGSADSTALLWNIPRAEQVDSIHLKEHVSCIASSPVEELVAIASGRSRDQNVHLFDRRSGSLRECQALKSWSSDDDKGVGFSHVAGVSFAAERYLVWCSSRDIKIFDLRQPQEACHEMAIPFELGEGVKNFGLMRAVRYGSTWMACTTSQSPCETAFYELPGLSGGSMTKAARKK